MSPLYDTYSCMDSASEEVVRVVAQKISSALSIMGSSHILMTVWEKWRTAKSSVDSYHRIMAGFSIFDILFSFFYWFLGTWMTPSETGWWGAVGNNQTCSMQGFFSILLYGSVMYQMVLSLQMLLLVTFMWTPNQFEFYLERKIHFFIVISAILIALIPLFFDGYNPKCGTCLPVPTPYWCGDWVLGSNATECARGDATMANIFQYLHWCFISLTTLFCSGSMLSIYLSIYFQEKRMTKYRFNNFSDDHEFHGEGNENENESDHSESKRIRKTVLLYGSSFYICWIIPLILWYAPHSVPSLHIVGDVLFALMGFFNMIVFIYPRCVKYQKDHPGMHFCTCYFYVLFNSQIKLVMMRFGSGDPTGIACTDVDDGIGFASSYLPQSGASNIERSCVSNIEETLDTGNNRPRSPVSVPTGAEEAHMTQLTWADEEVDAPQVAPYHTEDGEVDVDPPPAACGHQSLALVDEKAEAPPSELDHTKEVEDDTPAAACGSPLALDDNEAPPSGLDHTEDGKLEENPPAAACIRQMALFDEKTEAPPAELDHTVDLEVEDNPPAAACGIRLAFDDDEGKALPVRLGHTVDEEVEDNPPAALCGLQMVLVDEKAEAPPAGLDHSEDVELECGAPAATCGTPLALYDDEIEAPRAGLDVSEDIELS